MFYGTSGLTINVTESSLKEPEKNDIDDDQQLGVVKAELKAEVWSRALRGLTNERLSLYKVQGSVVKDRDDGALQRQALIFCWQHLFFAFACALSSVDQSKKWLVDHGILYHFQGCLYTCSSCGVEF